MSLSGLIVNVKCCNDLHKWAEGKAFVYVFPVCHYQQASASTETQTFSFDKQISQPSQTKYFPGNTFCNDKLSKERELGCHSRTIAVQFVRDIVTTYKSKPLLPESCTLLHPEAQEAKHCLHQERELWPGDGVEDLQGAVGSQHWLQQKDGAGDWGLLVPVGHCLEQPSGDQKAAVCLFSCFWCWGHVGKCPWAFTPYI